MSPNNRFMNRYCKPVKKRFHFEQLPRNHLQKPHLLVASPQVFLLFFQGNKNLDSLEDASQQVAWISAPVQPFHTSFALSGSAKSECFKKQNPISETNSLVTVSDQFCTRIFRNSFGLTVSRAFLIEPFFLKKDHIFY